MASHVVALVFGAFILVFAALWLKSLRDERRARGGKTGFAPVLADAAAGEDEEMPEAWSAVLDAWARDLRLARTGDATLAGSRGGQPVAIAIGLTDPGFGGPGAASRGHGDRFFLDLEVGHPPAVAIRTARVLVTPVRALGAKATGDAAFDARFSVAGGDPVRLDPEARALLLRGAGGGRIELRAFDGDARVVGEWPVDAPPPSAEVAALADAALRLLRPKGA